MSEREESPMGEHMGWDAEVEAAWVTLRQRVADAIAGLVDDEVILLEMTDLPRESGAGAAPYVQFLGWGDGLIRAEVVSNAHLSADMALEVEAYEQMGDIGWGMPTYTLDEEPDHGSANFWVDSELREADHLAWMGVRALREVFGCLHPALIDASGLDDEQSAHDEESTDADAQHPLPELLHASGPDELRAAVRAAVGEWLDSTDVKVDKDGDIPIRSGESVLFVRVSGKRPAVDLFAEIVIRPEHAERLSIELDILNRSHRLAKFHVAGDRVVMRHRLIAAPFVPEQLWLALDLLHGEADEVADELVRRVGGRKFLDRRPLPSTQPVDDCPAMAGLLELMSAGPVATGSVVELFEKDRREIVRMIVAVRSGTRDCRGLETDDVLDHLRRALEHVARHEARASRAASRLAVGDASQQLSLLDPATVQQAHTRRPRPRSA